MPRKSSSIAASYAKSSKRKKSKKRSPTRAPTQAPASSASNVSGKPPTPPAFRAALPATLSPKTAVLTRETASDYGYVLQELKKIAMVAGLMFAIIVILALFLR